MTRDAQRRRCSISRASAISLLPRSCSGWESPSFWIFGALAMIAGHTRRERVEPLVQDYRKFCRKLAAAGVAREPWEGAQHFAERAAGRFPGTRERAPQVRRNFTTRRGMERKRARRFVKPSARCRDFAPSPANHEKLSHQPARRNRPDPVPVRDHAPRFHLAGQVRSRPCISWTSRKTRARIITKS